MIESTCQCGALLNASEESIGTAIECPSCRAKVLLISAESLTAGSGAGDFDSKLIVTAGPQRVGEQLLVGGVQEISIGKLPERHISLPGNKVSRLHGTLVRLDFGPSRWELRDNNSTNGILVNGHRILNHELKHGDKIQIGEYELKYISALEDVIAKSKEKARQNHKGAICPSCGDLLAANAKICVKCGVDVSTGRSLVVSKGLDEDALAIRADTWIRALSWIMPFGLFPIASEAFGMKKPITTWVIFAITVVASIAFYVAMRSSDEPSVAVLNLMHWSGKRAGADKPPSQDQLQAKLKQYRESHKNKSDDVDDLSDEEIQELLDEALGSTFGPPPEVRFHWYQFFTSALIHDPSSVLNLVYHLVGNMVFFLVFGMRVNELIGNWRMTIVYPLLALGSGLADHCMHSSGRFYPSLGASGAVMGLAGMYFIFFPVQRVHMAIWFRGGMLTRWQCFYKVFAMRGFWLLVFWVGFNDLLPVFLGSHDGVAHIAHVGGFVTGMFLALVLLLSRQVSAIGNDLLSVVLGKRAWALVGRPDMAFQPI